MDSRTASSVAASMKYRAGPPIPKVVNGASATFSWMSAFTAVSV
jgi:hypothetical protein